MNLISGESSEEEYLGISGSVSVEMYNKTISNNHSHSLNRACFLKWTPATAYAVASIGLVILSNLPGSSVVYGFRAAGNIVSGMFAVQAINASLPEKIRKKLVCSHNEGY